MSYYVITVTAIVWYVESIFCHNGKLVWIDTSVQLISAKKVK